VPGLLTLGTSLQCSQNYSPDVCLHGCLWCCRHDWKICPYAHPGEVARRRHPRGYTAVLCPAKTAVRALELTLNTIALQEHSAEAGTARKGQQLRH
jgi:hypothetical protein